MHPFILPLMQGDIRIREKLQSAVVQSKPHVVFHIASFGMSGREMVRVWGLYRIVAKFREFRSNGEILPHAYACLHALTLHKPQICFENGH